MLINDDIFSAYLMKKGICLMALILILAVSALAAERYDLKDFSVEPYQAIVLDEGDIIQFNLLNGTHHMRIKEISVSNTSIKLNVYPFIGEDSKGSQVPYFGIDNVVYVDLDKDGVDDIVLDIHEINDRRVTLIIAKLDKAPADDNPEPPQGQGLVVKSVQRNYYRTFFIIGIAIIGLLGLLVHRKKKNGGKFIEIDEEKPKETD